ncbi:MAG: M28 family metallopeptidase [Flavobacteriales bacterium]
MRATLILFFSFLLLHGNAQVEAAKKWLDSLTSPNFHGRGYVNGGDSIAAEFLARRFQEFGLKAYGKSYFQLFYMQVNRFPGKMSVAFDENSLKPGVDFLVDPSSGGGEGRYKLFYVDLNNINQLQEKLKTAKNTAYVFEPGKYKGDTLSFINELMYFVADNAPVIKVQEEKFMWSVGRSVFLYPLIWLKKDVLDKVSGSDSVAVEFSVTQELVKHKTQNVIGYIQGKNKKAKPIVITAHYDHLGRMGSETVFPGANDNASGVSMMLTLMEHFSKNQPQRTIVFMAFAAEEAGILGSKHYVENPLFPLKNIRFLINIDLAGTGDDGVTVVNGTEFKEEFLMLSRINQEKQYLKEVRVRGRAANSDHYWFTLKGVPCFFIYTMGGVSHYHDIYDVAETLPLTKFNEYHNLLLDFINKLD